MIPTCLTTGATGVQFTSRARNRSRSALQDALQLTTRPGICSFALGLPGADLFPVAEYAAASEAVLACNPEAFQYGPPSVALKRHIVALMRRRGIECRESQILLTAGAQQALNLLVSLLLDRGRQVIVEEFSYPGFLQNVSVYSPEFLLVPTDFESGIDVDRVEWYLTKSQRPAFMYVITDGHNPLGVCVSEEKRDRLAALARGYRVPIIEEDPYGFLCYSERLSPPIRAREEEWVFYIGSFSKILAPGLRIGWIVAPEHLMERLAMAKESLDIDTATLSQHVAAHMLDSDFLPAHIERLRSAYRQRRGAMVHSLSEEFPKDTRWLQPECGVFLWVELSEYVDTSELVKKAVSEYRVAFLPGSVFAVDGCKGRHSMRLNFSHPSVESIGHGMSRLAELVTAACTV